MITIRQNLVVTRNSAGLQGSFSQEPSAVGLVYC